MCSVQDQSAAGVQQHGVQQPAAGVGGKGPLALAANWPLCIRNKTWPQGAQIPPHPPPPLTGVLDHGHQVGGAANVGVPAGAGQGSRRHRPSSCNSRLCSWLRLPGRMKDAASGVARAGCGSPPVGTRDFGAVGGGEDAVQAACRGRRREGAAGAAVGSHSARSGSQAAAPNLHSPAPAMSRPRAQRTVGKVVAPHHVVLVLRRVLQGWGPGLR